MNPTISSTDINALLCLRPTTEADMQLIACAQPLRLKTRYLGTDGERCLFFKYPRSTQDIDTKYLIEVDNQIVIRFVVDEPFAEVIAFKVRVLKVLHSPQPLLITSFPAALQKLGLRSKQRAISGVPAVVILDKQDNIELEGLVVDVSSSGCKLIFSSKSVASTMTNGESISLCIELSERTLLLSAKVKNNKIEKDYHSYGVSFDNNDSQLERLLERYVITL